MYAFNLLIGSGAVLATSLVLFLTRTVVYVPNNRIGILEKRWGLRGSVRSGLIALQGEAGYQPDVLRGGFHCFVPLQYALHITELVMIPQGQIGYVYARDGQALAPSQTLAGDTHTGFEDVRRYLAAGGQKGPQRAVLREGVYAINTAQFVVICSGARYALQLDAGDEATVLAMQEMIASRDGFLPVLIDGNDDRIGVVTVHDGPSLNDHEIIAPIIEHSSHNKFQDAEAFLLAGGQRGRQLQVLADGTYYINRLFATVELVRKTFIDVGFAGVVVSYTGERGVDLSGADYQHGELVGRDQRGVWAEALLPGKYAFNTYAGKVLPVPTTNFILKWESGVSGSQFDGNLKEVSLITRDAFEPSLPLSVVVNIDYRKAPLVIQRFGDIHKLVEQTLDPMVSAYFKNIAQTKTLIELLQQRNDIQQQAAAEMRERFSQYNLELQEVLIGTPRQTGESSDIERILNQLRSRQIAEEQQLTFVVQQQAAIAKRELHAAEAKAESQTRLTQSEIEIAVMENAGKAEAIRATQTANQMRELAKGEADKRRIEAEGEAQKIRQLADAEAMRIMKVGESTAEAARLQVEAYGGAQYRFQQEVLTTFAHAIKEAKLPIVPQVVVGNSEGGNGLAGLISALASDKLLELSQRGPSNQADSM